MLPIVGISREALVAHGALDVVRVVEVDVADVAPSVVHRLAFVAAH